MDIVLASGSPRRKELLTQMGLSFRVAVSNVDEHVDNALPPDRLVTLLSRRKADAAASAQGPDALIIAADTVVALDGTVMGKPHSEEEAACMLRTLSGRTHQVYTGFTLRRGDRVSTHTERTCVTFRHLTDAQIAAYIATGEPMDKAGAYGIQGLGGVFITGITGDYFNVMGLPICALALALQDFGVEVMGQP